MDKQTTIAFILIGAILILWLYLTAPDPNQQTKPKSDTTQLKDTLLNSEKQDTISINQPKENIKNDLLVKRTKQDSIPEVITVIETDLARFELSNKGGNFKKIFLKKFNNWYTADKKENQDDYLDKVQLLNYSKGGSYDISFVSIDGHGINTKDFTLQSSLTSTNVRLTGKDSIKVDYVLQLEPGKTITKTFIFFADKYEVKSDIIFSGLSSNISSNSYDLVWNNGIRFVEKNSVDEASYSNASVYYGDEQVIVNASSTGEKEVKEFRGRIDWLAVRNKYFAVVIIPDNPQKVEGAYIEGISNHAGKDGLTKQYNARLTLPFQNKAEEKQSFTLFIGPVDYKELESYGRNLVAIVDFGSFFGLKFIVRPIAEYILLPLFLFINSFIPNYGVVLIIFSIIIKIAVYPLTKSSFQSMKKMQALQPMITELKEKYNDDPQKMNKETMKLYSTYGINPAGGCLPMLLQMPIFIALWGLFKSAIELRQQPFFGWITDLSQPDVIFNIGYKIPIFGISEISGLALLMGITTFVQQKMTVKDPKQQALVYMMPVMLTLLFMSFPSGLNLYYFMFNILSIAQQYYINHKGGKVELVPVANPKKKKGFMSKLMEAAEEQAKTQQKRRK